MRGYKRSRIAFSEAEVVKYADFFYWKKQEDKTLVDIKREAYRKDKIRWLHLFTDEEIEVLKVMTLDNKVLHVIIALRREMVHELVRERLSPIVETLKKSLESEFKAHPEYSSSKRELLKRNLDKVISEQEDIIRKAAVGFAAQAHLESTGTSKLIGYIDMVYPVKDEGLSVFSIMEAIFKESKINPRFKRFIKAGEVWS
jgi:hypothetical protein